MIFIITKSEAGNDIKIYSDIETTDQVCFDLAHCRTQRSCPIKVQRKKN